MTIEIYSVKKVAYSSVVGQSIMLLNKAGNCIGQLALIGCTDPQGMADQIVPALATGLHMERLMKEIMEKAKNDD